MIDIEKSIVINKPVEEVFAYLRRAGRPLHGEVEGFRVFSNSHENKIK